MGPPSAIFALALLLASCHAKISGDLKLDGKPFEIANCRSGQAFGFSGIEISDQHGTRIRLLLQADGSVQAAVFAAGASKGDLLDNCGTLDVHAQNSRINSITNVEGKASLSCDTSDHQLHGSFNFENCH